MDFGWTFSLGDPADAEKAAFNDTSWRKLDLPHDWSIEGPWLKDNPSGPAGGYASLGIGWYRKKFAAPADFAGKSVYLEFDGVFNHADVWINGEKVGHNEYGYIGFECDVTPWLRAGRDNVIAVRVDNNRQASRWYTGSGIYRHVWLSATEHLHVAHWGTFITTPDASTVKIETTVRNDSDTARDAVLATKLDSGESAESKISVAQRSQIVVTQTIHVTQPHLWSLEDPHVYRATSEVAGTVYESTFGIRTTKWDPANGFALNGKRIILKGVNLHHDLGALGAAAFADGYARRLRILKSMGVNAIRLSHNPHDPQLLDLADRMGFLIFDEAFDKWYGFEANEEGTGWKRDLEAMIRRDRNHPSVIIWSTGNEMTPHMYMREGTRLMQAMAAVVHGLDPTRPVTAGLHPVRTSGGVRDAPLAELANFMDVISMNYQTQWYPRDHQQHPNQVFIGSEVHVHQNELEVKHQATDWRGNQWFGTQDYNTNEYFPYVAGQFIWAGFDYLGESSRVLWPSKGSRENIITTSGERRGFSYYEESLYSEKPMVRIAVDNPEFKKDKRKYDSHDFLALLSHWNLPNDLKTARVYTFTNAPVVELFLNGKSLGEKRLKDFGERIVYWEVPNEPGTLRAVAKDNGKAVATHELKTAGPAVRLELIADRDRAEATGQDLVHVDVRALDANGIVVPGANGLVQFEIAGPGKIAGMDNGDLDDQSPFQGNQRELRDGKCLLIIQTAKQTGRIALRAHAAGVPGTAAIEIDVRAGSPLPSLP